MEVYPRVTSDARHSFAELREHAECIRLADVAEWDILVCVCVCVCVCI